MISHKVGHIAPGSRLQPAGRLRVLITRPEVDSAIVAQKIRELANALGGPVQFIGLCTDPVSEPGVRRQMATLCAMVRNEHITAEAKIESGPDWLKAVRSEWHTADVIACITEPGADSAPGPLHEILESNLNVRVYMLTGIHSREKWQRSSWVSNLVIWVGSIGIVLGFFWLQLRLTQLPGDWAHTALLYLSIFAEAGMIWFWNSLCG